MQWNEFRAHLRHMSAKELEKIQEAYQLGAKMHGDQKRRSGEPYFNHPIAVATMLAGMGADADTIAAALLHDALEDTPLTLSQIEQQFGRTISELVDGVTKLTRADIGAKPTLNEQIETLRKMFQVMQKDVRIIVIKLIDRLHNMQTAEFLPEDKRHLMIKETMEVYIKIADRLSMQDIRDELKSLCLAFLEPEMHRKLSELRTENEARGERLLNTMIHKLEKERPDSLQHVTLKYEHKRWDKLQEQIEMEGMAATGVASLVIAFICNNTDDCYQMMGILHQLWQRETLSFQDYINSPMINGYKGLHTTIILEDGTRVRCKIRTKDMHEYAHKGITALCFKGEPRELLEYLPWTQRISPLAKATENRSEEFWRSLQSDVLGESIIIHSASDETVLVPQNATALDGAFYLFGDRALRIETLMLNGKIVPFHSPLSYADSIEAYFASHVTTSHEWLNWVKTGIATAKIRTALGAQLSVKKPEQGRLLLQQEFDRYSAGDVQRRLRHATHLLPLYNIKNIEDLFVLVAEGTIDPSDVLKNLRKKSTGIFAGLLNFLRRSNTSTFSTLRISIHGENQGKEHNIQKTIDQLSEQCNVILQRLAIKQRKNTYTATVLVHAEEKNNIDRFFAQLEAQPGVLRISAMPSTLLILQLAGIFLVTVATWFVSFFFLHSIAVQHMHTLFAYSIALPIVLCNIVAYRYISDYVAIARYSRLFISSILLVNAVTIGLFTVNLLGSELDILQLSLFFPLTVLVLSGIAIIWIFTKRGTAANAQSVLRGHRYTAEEWRQHQREKIFGYLIRLGAVVIWGIEPLYIKYTVINDLSPLLRVFLKATGGLLPSLVLGIIVAWSIQRKPVNFRLPYNKIFAVIVIGELLFAYFMNSSLIFTSGTNMILINSFAPVIGLIIAAIFWRDQIPYLRQSKHFMKVFMLFVLGSIGSSFIFYNDIRFATSEHLWGDTLSMMTMLADVFLVIAMIRYVKSLSQPKSIELNFNIFLCTLLLTAPFALLSSTNIWQLTAAQWAFGLGAGILSGFGRIMNFAAFRRIDGFLAFLMFNISIFITFAIEAFYIKGIVSTPLLVIGGLLIIGASIGAEYINTKSEREAL